MAASIIRETRSQAKTRKYLESLHPQCVEAFKEGLGSILRQWTALELAIHHQVINVLKLMRSVLFLIFLFKL